MITHNGRKIHLNRLVCSDPDTVALGNAVEVRFLGLCESYFNVKGENLTFPSYLDSDVLLWRTMIVRHKMGDYRNTLDERKATQRLADWTLRVNCSLRNQVYAPVEWTS